MEYNDSQVMDWDFKRHYETRCFGNKKESSASNSGTSAYMLFYERVKKKDIRLVLTKDKLDFKDEDNLKEFKEYL